MKGAEGESEHPRYSKKAVSSKMAEMIERTDLMDIKMDGWMDGW